MTRHDASMPAPVAAGFTALLASGVAALWLWDVRWLAVGVAALLAGAAWSTVRRGDGQ